MSAGLVGPRSKRGEARELVPWGAMLLEVAAVISALVGRRLGASESVAAASLVVVACGIPLLRAALRASREGAPAPAAFALATAVFAVAVAPALASILPGRAIVTAVLQREGNSVKLPAGTAGPVRVLVSSEFPEDGRTVVPFELTLGTERLEGTLERSVRHWRAARGVRHYRVERSCVYLDARVERGVQAISLSRFASTTERGIEVAVYRRTLSGWLAVLAGCLTFAVAGAFEALIGPRSQLAPSAGAAIATGTLAGWTATPHHALEPVIASLALGSAAGVAAGLVLSRAAARARVVRTRASPVGGRHRERPGTRSRRAGPPPRR